LGRSNEQEVVAVRGTLGRKERFFFLAFAACGFGIVFDLFTVYELALGRGYPGQKTLAY